MEYVGKSKSAKKKKKPVLWIVLSIVAIIQIFPLIWLLDFSLASSNEMFTSGLLIIPKKIQWGNYVKAFVDGSFLHYLKNSVLINGLAVVLVILMYNAENRDIEVDFRIIFDDGTTAIYDGDDDSDSCNTVTKL